MNQYLSGLPAWLVQRLSALYLGLFSISALLWWWLGGPQDYAHWHGLFASVPISIAVGLFIVALLLHGWVGMRDIILDYLGHHAALRLLLLGLLGGALAAQAVWALRILNGAWA